MDRPYAFAVISEIKISENLLSEIRKRSYGLDMEFLPFPKIARLSRECVITEKIDGTNGLVEIVELPDDQVMPTDTPIVAVRGKFLLYAGSRTKYITPDDDNYGFARWVKERAEELVELGTGRHFGEWWGQGIQRKYGMKEKVFSLFNAGRWVEVGQEPKQIPCGDPRIVKFQSIAPACCRVVPVLTSGIFSTIMADNALNQLIIKGSFASPGFMHPEGIVIYHTAANSYFKKTLHKDEEFKGKS